MTSSLAEAAGQLRHWLVDQSLPLWLEVGMHSGHGGHYEALDGRGQIDREASIRVRVQARQVFTFAYAHHRGWCDGEAAARRVMAFAEQHTAHPGAGGFTHRMSPDFELIDTRQDLYDHAFFLLAYAWGYRAFGERVWLERAGALVAYLDERFGSEYGGWVEGDYEAGQRRQNPHMHLFEAFMTLYEVSGEARWLARAGEIFALFQTRFFDPGRGVLFEYFESDWRLKHPPEKAPIEPGHMFEWVWLLDWYQRLTGRPVADYTGPLFERARATGLLENGLVLDETLADGTPLKRSCRSWGLMEYIKACLVRARQGEPQAEVQAAEGLDTLNRYYLCGSRPGTHVDQRGPGGELLADQAPASTLYHLVVLLGEVGDYTAGKG